MLTTIIIIALVALLINQYMKNKRLSAETQENYAEVHSIEEHSQHAHGSGMRGHQRSSHGGHGCC